MNDYGWVYLSLLPLNPHSFPTLVHAASIASQGKYISEAMYDSVAALIDSVENTPLLPFDSHTNFTSTYDGKTTVREQGVPKGLFMDKEQTYKEEVKNGVAKSSVKSVQEKFEADRQQAINHLNVQTRTYLAAGYARKAAMLQSRLLWAVIGCLILAVLVLLLIFWNWRGRTQRKHQAEHMEQEQKMKLLSAQLKQKETLIASLRGHIIDKSEILEMLEPTTGKRTVINARNWQEIEATLDTADGLFVSRQIVEAPYGVGGEAYFFLPEIPGGEHTFRLVWHNWEVNTFLCVQNLRFVTFGGPDADGNGIPDWRDNRNASASGFDELPLESLVSPLCVEGKDLWRDVLEIGAEYVEGGSNGVFAAVKTIGDGFYADIPLAEYGQTRIAFADRALSNDVAVAWKPLDVFEEDFVSDALVIRTGDALRLAGEGTVSVSRADVADWTVVTYWSQTAATPYRFDQAGTYLITVSRENPLLDGETGYAQVEVVSSKFPKRNPAIMIDRAQSLACPALAPRNLIEHDAALQVTAEPDGSGGVDLTLCTHTDRDMGLLSRLDEDGPISDAVQVTSVWADNGTYYRVAQTYPDGSQLVEVSLLLGALAENMSVTLEIFVSGVTFEDGTRTKTLTAADFDENGRYVIRFIKARGVTTSVCHRTYIYQDGKLIYTNKEN